MELYEHHPALNILEKIDPRSAGNLDTWLLPHRESESLLKQARPALDGIIAMAPKAVTIHPAAQSHEVWLRFRGLPFARWDDGRIFFGINDALEVLTPVSRPSLKRLLHIELKASEHIHLPLQAADYWLRVRRHLENGEIARYGYFQKVALQQASPLVYLVAPALRFHPTTDDLLDYLSPELEIVRVGLAETWRGGLRVVMRQ